MNREFGAGGVVFKEEGGSSLWLVRRNSPSKLYPEENMWTLPKGMLDKGETTKEAAAREVKEEGGVEVEILEKVFDQRMMYTPRGGVKTFKLVSYFLMKYLRDTEEGFSFETAEVAWLPYQEAGERLTYSSEKKVLEMATLVLEGKKNE